MDPATAHRTPLSNRVRQETKPVTADQAKFNNLPTSTVPVATALLPQSNCRNAVESRKRLMSDDSDTDSVPRKRAKIEPIINREIPQPDEFRSRSELSGKFSFNLAGPDAAAQKRLKYSKDDPLQPGKTHEKPPETGVLPAKSEPLRADTNTASAGSPALVFRNMDKLEISRPNLFPGSLVKYFRCADGTLGQENFTECGNVLKKLTGVYVFDEFYKGNYYRRSTSTFSRLKEPYSIYAGQMDDGMFFLRTLRPDKCARLFKLDHQHQKIQYQDCKDSQAKSEVHPFALYCGKSYVEALAAFELACKGTDLATFIRPLLGFGSDSFSTIRKAHKLPDSQPEEAEPEPMDWTAVDLS
ncbi:hypothetical protein [Endozoicomonas sp. ONNA2]|uniref:hypothetical protein n=1 Tax=Endozoicomonas sp. ONNA2 TaxID=2828741 RepID=UPI0021496963|nr:hypothetical protein [Endozoicomonas sp. ONNA2]